MESLPGEEKPMTPVDDEVYLTAAVQSSGHTAIPDALWPNSRSLRRRHANRKPLRQVRQAFKAGPDEMPTNFHAIDATRVW